MTEIPRRLALNELDAASNVLARAFENDPLWVYILPETQAREVNLRKFFRALCRLSIENGTIYGVSSPLEGVVIWSVPDQPAQKFSISILREFLPLLFSSFIFQVFRTISIFSQFEVLRKKYSNSSYYYLNNIGVVPAAQGKGLASRLIRPFLKEADLRGVGAYTETMTPSNVPIYLHFGFNLMEEYKVPKTGLKIWSFHRPPKDRMSDGSSTIKSG